MTSPNPVPPDCREQLRQEWLAAAASAFDRMFADAEQGQLITFDQREARACLLGLDLGAWLLERHVAADPQIRPPENAPAPCPKCGRPAQRVTARDDPLPRRPLKTLAGEVELRREQWHCKTCRVFFFPLDHKLQLGTEG
jgi:hypothetical protein